MTLLWLCVIWAFASAAVAMLPLRQQYVPGVALMLAAPVLIVMVGLEVGGVAALFALAAFVSMYRNPLRALLARLRQGKSEVP